MLEGRHYQNAYVTHDITNAVEVFKRRADVRKIIETEVEVQVTTTQGLRVQHNKLAFIWVKNLQYELIQPVDGLIDIYRQGLPEIGPMAFHHICMRVPDWNQFRERVDRKSYPVVLEGGGEALKFLYLDAREILGHYLEYTWMTDERWKQMGGE